MTTRRDRLVLAARHAEAVEHRALVRRAEAAGALRTTDEEREAVLDRAGSLARQGLSSELQGHLASVGANHLVALTDTKLELTTELRSRQRAYDAARARRRSLERVVERLDEVDRLDRRRRSDAELRDVLAARTTRRKS